MGQHLFAPDTELNLRFLAELINTGVDDTEDLVTVADLSALLDEWSVTGRRERTRSELEQIRALRTELGEIWNLAEDDAVPQVNEILRRYDATPQLVRHESYPEWHIHATADNDPLIARVAVEAAMALLDVYRADESDRLGRCSADDCSAAFIDLTRNRSKRFCDTGNCANRSHVAAYRRRQRA